MTAANWLAAKLLSSAVVVRASMANSDYRLQLNVALLGLEQTHLAKQSYETGRHLLLQTAELSSASGYLRDVLSRLHECSKTARKYRYRWVPVSKCV